MNRPLLTSQDVVFVVEMRVPDASVLGIGNTTLGNCAPDALVLLLGKTGHTSDYLLTQFGFSRQLHR